MVRKKKKSQWRKSHTSCSQDLSPWQLSPPASPRTNWNCLHVSIVFISWLKVIVPLNEITHSVWVPCLIRTDLKQKLRFHGTANTNIGNLELHHCFWTQLYLWDHAWVRHNTMENRNLLLCYFCPSGLWCHTVNPLTGITAALQYWANVMVSSHLSAGPLDPWACARVTWVVVMCGVQLWTWQIRQMQIGISSASKYRCHLCKLHMPTGLGAELHKDRPCRSWRERNQNMADDIWLG